MKLATAEAIKKYFWKIFGIIGIVFFWAGIWDGIGSLPYLKTWWVSIFLGLIMMAFSGLFLKENNLFGGFSSPVTKILHTINDHPEKHLFHISYFDKLDNRSKKLAGSQLKRIERNFVVFLEEGRERFIPVHRITEILHRGRTRWKP